jgi:hypothetical protein
VEWVGKGGGGGRGEKWTKPCMHIWIIKETKKEEEATRGQRRMIGIDWSPNAALLSDDTTEITLKSELFITSPSVLWQPQLALRGNDTYCISC